MRTSLDQSSIHSTLISTIHLVKVLHTQPPHQSQLTTETLNFLSLVCIFPSVPLDRSHPQLPVPVDRHRLSNAVSSLSAIINRTPLFHLHLCGHPATAAFRRRARSPYIRKYPLPPLLFTYIPSFVPLTLAPACLVCVLPSLDVPGLVLTQLVSVCLSQSLVPSPRNNFAQQTPPPIQPNFYPLS
jgi:hypothetical protein